MPQCLKCGAELPVNEEGMAPVLCDRCAGRATSRARRGLSVGGLARYPVTTALLAINVVAFLLQMIPALHVTEWGVNYGPWTLSGQYWRLFSAGFLHANILHIAVNMWCLWSLGHLSERLFGKWQTFMIYMLTGVGGALLSIAKTPDHAELGASGAVFGIVGAVMAGVKFGDLDISAGEKRAVFSSAVSFAVLNFVLGFSQIGSGIFGTVDNMCHLGGFVTGLLVGLPLGAFAKHHKVLQWTTLLVTAALLTFGYRELVETHGIPQELRQAQAALDRRDLHQAIQWLERYTSSHPGDDHIWTVLGRLYAENNDHDRAVAALQQALKANPDSAEAKIALSNLGGSVPAQK